MIRLTKVETRANYRLYVEFADGLAGEIDMTSTLWGPMFEPLKDEAFFRQVKLESGVPSWPNGADVAPDALYAELNTNHQVNGPA